MPGGSLKTGGGSPCHGSPTGTRRCFSENGPILSTCRILNPARGARCNPRSFVPLVGFTADGQRLGQGGGHYDRWLAAHPDTVAIGLAWDMQLADELPTEPHDRPLAAVVTPTRIYEGHPA
jgi:5,10-methenyltetrahydrofolate synthetase